MNTSLFLVVVFADFAVNAQAFNLGVNAGLSSGDASDAYSLSVHLDANYHYEVSEGFNVGAPTGFLYVFGDSVGAFEFEDAKFILIAAAARYFIWQKFSVGADLG